MSKLKPDDFKRAARRGFLGGQVWLLSERAAYTDGPGYPVMVFAGYDDAMRYRREKYPRARLEHDFDGRYVWSTAALVIEICKLPVQRYAGSLPEEVLK